MKIDKMTEQDLIQAIKENNLGLVRYILRDLEPHLTSDQVAKMLVLSKDCNEIFQEFSLLLDSEKKEEDSKTVDTKHSEKSEKTDSIEIKNELKKNYLKYPSESWDNSDLVIAVHNFIHYDILIPNNNWINPSEITNLNNKGWNFFHYLAAYKYQYKNLLGRSSIPNKCDMEKIILGLLKKAFNVLKNKTASFHLDIYLQIYDNIDVSPLFYAYKYGTFERFQFFWDNGCRKISRGSLENTVRKIWYIHSPIVGDVFKYILDTDCCFKDFSENTLLDIFNEIFILIKNGNTHVDCNLARALVSHQDFPIRDNLLEMFPIDCLNSNLTKSEKANVLVSSKKFYYGTKLHQKCKDIGIGFIILGWFAEWCPNNIVLGNENENEVKVI